jgi:hypothetical protein
MQPPLHFVLPGQGAKKSVLHYGFGEIINDRCTNATTRTLLRYLKTESRVAHSRIEVPPTLLSRADEVIE